jgi:hypothetical protein
MPRSPSGVYTVPPGTDGVPDTTIESTKYNGFAHDVETDLNAVRPIIAGGTGATDATTARANIKAEVSTAQVTNYDVQAWEPGSFYSAAGATSAPVAGHRFAGICYGPDAANMVLEARDLDDAAVPGLVYVKEKTAGVWSAWTLLPGSTAGQYVLKAGDTMTGSLSIYANSPTVVLNNTATTLSADMYFYQSGVGRWLLRSGGNPANDFYIYRFNDAGAALDTPISISRATGLVSVVGDPTAALGVATKQYTDAAASTKVAKAGDSMTGPITFTYTGSSNGTYFSTQAAAQRFFIGADGTNDNLRLFSSALGNFITFSSAGTTTFSQQVIMNGTLNATGATFAADITCMRAGAPTSGLIFFGNTSTKYIYWDGSANFVFNGGGVTAGTGFIGKSGYSGGTGTEVFNIKYNAGPVALWIDNSNMGNIAFTSDYRTKKDVVALPATWDVVKALRPIKYTHQDYTPVVEMERAKEKGEPFVKADNVERWGFIAHELQETLIQDAATGVKDDPVCIQSPNPWTVIAALTRALQEAMTRIEALEASVTA